MSNPLLTILLPVLFVCLAAWPFPFVALRQRYRFEFFTLDFSIAAAVAGVLLAFMLGNLSLPGVQVDLELGDRLLIASRTATAITIFGGLVFGIAFLTLFGAVRLLGLGLGFAFLFGTAGLIDGAVLLSRALTAGHLAGFVCCALAVTFGFLAARKQDDIVPAKARNLRHQPVRNPVRTSTKGLMLALFSGILFSIAIPLTASGLSGDLGLGPFSGLLILTPMLPLMVLPFSAVLLNIRIDQPPTSMRSYLAAGRRDHVLAWISGAVWTLGTFLLFLTAIAGARTAAASNAPSLAAAGAIACATLAGFLRERGGLKGAGRAAIAVASLFVGLLALVA